MPDFELDYDEGVWIVLPVADEVTPADRREWARRTARARRPGTAGDSDAAEELAATLARIADRLGGRHGYDPDVAELVLLHHPVDGELPLPVHVHVWPQSETDRDEELRALVRADDPEAVEPPVVERFDAPGLGEGLRAVSWFPLDDDRPGLYAVLSYAWRIEELGADVRVSCSTPDVGAMALAVGDIEELVGGLRVPGAAAPSAGRPPEWVSAPDLLS